MLAEQDQRDRSEHEVQHASKSQKHVVLDRSSCTTLIMYVVSQHYLYGKHSVLREFEMKF